MRGIGSLRRSDAARAAGMGVAVAGGNVVSLALTIVFARLLGPADYGSLAALISALLILSIAGTALQATVARDVAAAHGAGEDAVLAAEIPRWTRALVLGTVAAGLLAAVLREPIAAVIGVPQVWAAASSVPLAGAWIVVSVYRGALQGLGAYSAVGRSVLAEAVGRLVFGLLLVLVGAGVTGAFVGHGIALVAVALWLGVLLDRRLADAPAADRPSRHALGRLLRASWAPSLTTGLLAALLNLDIIVAKQVLPATAAGTYAAAALPAKAIVWIAVGLGLFLLPEASRRSGAGQATRKLLAESLGLATAAALPILLVYALAGEQLLLVLFGSRFTDAASFLAILGLAMTMLAYVQLVTQYLLARGRARFLWLLAAATVAEPVVLALVDGGARSLALAVLAVQAALFVALAAFELAAASRPGHRGGQVAERYPAAP